MHRTQCLRCHGKWTPGLYHEGTVVSFGICHRQLMCFPLVRVVLKVTVAIMIMKGTDQTEPHTAKPARLDARW